MRTKQNSWLYMWNKNPIPKYYYSLFKRLIYQVAKFSVVFVVSILCKLCIFCVLLNQVLTRFMLIVKDPKTLKRQRKRLYTRHSKSPSIVYYQCRYRYKTKNIRNVLLQENVATKAKTDFTMILIKSNLSYFKPNNLNKGVVRGKT